MTRIRLWVPLAAIAVSMLCSCGQTDVIQSSLSGTPATITAQSRASRAIKVTCPPQKNPSKPTEGKIRIDSPRPQNSLIPANADDRGSRRIINALFSGLVSYGQKGEPKLDVAKSIETTDSKLFTVSLNSDRRFSNGTPVTSRNFVDAWKLASKENMLLAHSYAPIMGTNSLGVGTLSGLKIVSDTVFTITLKKPQINFVQQLGQTSFFPLSDYTLKNLNKNKIYGQEEWGESGNKNSVRMLIGNGPYKAEKTFTEQKSLTEFSATPNPYYKGNYSPMNDGIIFTYRSSPESAYSQLKRGQLDVVTKIPISAFESYITDFPCQNINAPAALPQTLAIPYNLEHFSGTEGMLRRKAISLAINRDKISEKVFSGTRSPSKDFTSPILRGFNPTLSGNDVLTFNPAEARKAWEQANTLSPWDGKLTVFYLNSSGDKESIDATARSIESTLSIAVQSEAYPSSKSWDSAIKEHRLKGLFYISRAPDYPSRLSFLSSMYMSGSKANASGYANPEFDKLITQAITASSAQEEKTFTDKSEELLLQDLPTIPLWNSNITAGWISSVGNVLFRWDGEPLLSQITKES